MINGLLVEVLSWNDLLDNLVENGLAQLFELNGIGMLGGNNDCVNAERHDSTTVVLILDSDLSFGIWSQPFDFTRLSCLI